MNNRYEQRQPEETVEQALTRLTDLHMHKRVQIQQHCCDIEAIKLEQMALEQQIYKLKETTNE